MSQGFFRDEGKKDKKGKKVLGKTFTLHHCYDVLKDEEKWTNRGKVDVPTMLARQATAEATIIDDDVSSGGEDRKRSSTPHSVANTRRPELGRRKAKEMRGKKSGDDDIAIAMENMAKARKEYNEDKKEADARRVALEERLAAAEERRMAMEEKKLANEEHQRLLDEERKLFFMDTSNMDERQKEYINLARDEVLDKKRKLANLMKAQNEGMSVPGGFGCMGGYGAPPGGYGFMGQAPMGYGGMGGFGVMGAQPGGFGVMGAQPGGFGGYGGMGLGSMGGVSGHSAMGGMGGMSGHAAMGGMGAPPGGFMASSVDPTPSTNEAHGDSTPNTIVQDSEEDGDGFDHIDK